MKKREKISFLKIVFYSSFFSIILIIILILITTSFLKTFFREKNIRKEVIALEEEIKKLEGERSDLSKILEYLKSDFYKEKEAREKFGLQKPGEKTIVILPTEETSEKPVEKKMPNFKKWWQYIFK
ncbi:MAG: FtsB family cell division protein [Patescibacteria group bacterium]